MLQSKIYIIMGPTSAGKTTLALDLAKQYNGEVISADSRQIYKYMDVGTGKLPIQTTSKIQKADQKWLINGINIWGYDLVTPDKYFSAYEYASFALDKAKELLEQGKNIFLVGGTGLYINVFTAVTKVSNIKPDQKLRAYLQNLSTEDLINQLTSLNLQRSKDIDKQNRMRLIRALEIEKAISKTTTPLPYLTNIKYEYIGLTADRQILYDRADKWLDTVWYNGLISEVENLLRLGFRDSPKLDGLVYKSVLSYLSKEQIEEQAKERAKFDLHSYIRRQQTWFKRNPNITWFDITQENFSQNIKNLVELG